jgi:predicted nucleic acid-binding protein
MSQILWDASSLAKRYVPELGSDIVDALFSAWTSLTFLAAYLVYAETCAVLRRKHNRADISLAAFTTARGSLRHEVLLNPSFGLMTIEDDDILAGVTLSDQHNLNSTDAAILAAYLRFAHAQPATASACVIVTADQRFFRASSTEGLRTINPEMLPAADVPAFLASV